MISPWISKLSGVGSTLPSTLILWFSSSSSRSSSSRNTSTVPDPSSKETESCSIDSVVPVIRTLMSLCGSISFIFLGLAGALR